MKRFFFDVSSKSHVRYDYQGREFSHPEQAFDLAELIALDLGCSDDVDTADLEVQVRNIGGTCLFAVPIRRPELQAA